MKLSYSSIQSYLSCERRFEWQKIVEIEREIPAKTLRIGSAYHVALNILKQGGTLNSALAAIEGMYGTVPAFISDPNEWWVEREISMRLAMGWHDHMLPLKVIASECEFTLKIKHPVTGKISPFELHGYLDAIIEDEYRQIALMEHKTTDWEASPHSLYADRLAIDLQVDLYILASRELGFDVKKVVYDVTRKPQIRPRRLTKAEAKAFGSAGLYHGERIPPQYQGERETFAMFGARLTSHINKDPSKYFKRYPIVRLDREIQKARIELWEQTERIRTTLKRDHFLKNSQSCLSPYRCPYAGLCLNGTEPRDVKENGIPTGYRKRDRR